MVYRYIIFQGKSLTNTGDLAKTSPTESKADRTLSRQATKKRGQEIYHPVINN